MFNDFEWAKKLQDNEFKAKKRIKGSKESTKENESLIDPTWELIDPNPNIHSLFIAFDKKYFWNTLGSVEVKWSPRMYSCAGICTYKGRGGCVVSLSLPLLKLRPRKDLIETLLHEMIHAYLFLTKNDRDRDGHGPQFHSHMYRINAEAGTHITVYHTFHDEVRHYKTHWWRCDGPCRDRKPFFGIVKRAMNRAPGRYDRWYGEHQATCGGNFIKIQEPEGFKTKRKKGETAVNKLMKPIVSVSPKKVLVPSPDIRKFFNLLPPNNSGPVPTSNKAHPKAKKLDFSSTSSEPPHVQKPVGKPNIASVNNISANSNATMNKINNTSNVHGFGSLTGGTSRGGLKSNMGGTLVETKIEGKTNVVPRGSAEVKHPSIEPFSGTGYALAQGTTCDRSKSRLLSLYPPPPPKKIKIEETPSEPSKSHKNVPCPVCGVDVRPSKIHEHLDSCVQIDLTEEPVDIKNLPPSPEKSLFASCPVCGKSVYKTKINEHLDECVNNSFDNLSSDADTNMPSTSSSFTTDPPSPSKGLFANCPVCDVKVYKNKMDEHLDSCIRLDSIMDDSGCEIVDLDKEEGSSDEVRCPCCDIVLAPSDINTHLDSCLHYLDFE